MPKNRKIVLIGTHPPTIGGISTYIHNLNRRLLKDNYNVVVFDVVKKTKFDKKAIDASNPLKLIIAFFSYYFKGFRIFHFNTSQKAIPLIILFPFLFLPGSTVICSIHSGDYHNWLLSSKTKSLIYKIIFSSVDWLVFMNEEQAEIVRKELNLSNVCSVSSFLVLDPRWYGIKEKYNLSRPIKISTMGLWQKYYRYEDVIEACILVSKSKGLKFQIDVIVGTSNPNVKYKRIFLEFINNMITTDVQINLIEDQSNMLEYLSNRDVFIRGSEIDSYGLCVAEALLVGTRTIATDVCKRAPNTILYSAGNINDLKEKLSLVLNNLNSQHVRKCLLPSTEDSYNNILKLYYT